MTPKQVVNRFNRGEVDRRATARQDVERVKDSGTLMENWMPIRLGGMQYRPGWEVTNAALALSYFIPFVAATDDVALLEVSSSTLRVWVNDAPISRPAVSAAVTNPNFATDISGWTDDSDVGGSATWLPPNYATLIGNGTAQGAMYQTVVVSNPGVEHALRISVVEAPVRLSIGTTVGGTDIYDGVLGEGVHSLAFTPVGNFTVRFSNSNVYRSLINLCTIDSAGIMTLPIAAPPSLSAIRFAQSVDVTFFAGYDTYQQRIERRGIRSWSVVKYRSNDGPFESINATGIMLTPGAFSGNTSLTADRALFLPSHVGALFKLVSPGQFVSSAVAADDIQTASIRVTGVNTGRNFTITIAGTPTFTATVTLQRSFDDATWEDLNTYTVNTTAVYNDSLANQIIYYRLNVKAGDYVLGSLTMSLTYAGGTTTGICRVNVYDSPTLVYIQVFEPFGSLNATTDWYEGSWSDLRGYPSAVTLHEGRLWFAGKNRLWGSVSDVFDSFDRDITGDSASIQRTIGFGPADRVEWLFPATRLFMGLASNEIGVRSNTFDEPLDPTNTNLKKGSNQGVAPFDVVETDNKVYYIQRSQSKIFELDYSSDSDTYPSIDTNVLTPRLTGAATYVRMAVTRQPETRVYAVLSDGTMRVYLNDTAEDVRGWCRVTLPLGSFKDVVVLPGVREDIVYAVVEIGGNRYLTRLGMFEDAVGGSKSQHLDLGRTYTSPGAFLTDLGHIDGASVRVWADGADRGAFSVYGDIVTLPANTWINVTVGLAHTANWASNKLTDYVDGWVLNHNKRVDHIGFVLENTLMSTLFHGSDAANLQPMPLVERGAPVSLDAVVPYYDELPAEFNGTYDSDSRVYLRATGPATVLALSFNIDDPNTATK